MHNLILIFYYFASLCFFAAAEKNGTPPATPPEKDIALILKASGPVQIGSDAKTWQEAARGARLHAGTQVRTGEQALAAIVFTDDKSLLKVRSNSKVVINGKREAAASGSQRIVKTISMEIGELWAKVTKGAAPFRIETPSGVAAVKGTIFYTALTSDGKMIIICLDGVVELINSLGSVLVNAGQTGICAPGQTPESHNSTPGEMPNWANDDGSNNELEIEFQDQNGQKKKLKIRYQ